MTYLVKSTLNGSNWGWYWASTVTVRELAGLHAGTRLASVTQPHVVCAEAEPIQIFGGGVRRITSQQGWHSIFLWLEKGQIGEAPPKPKAFPKWIPPAVREMPFSFIIDYALLGSPFRAVFQDHYIAKAISEDLILQACARNLYTPLFFPEDSNCSIIQEWAKCRPEEYRYAQEDADRVSEDKGIPPSLIQARRMLRIEAHRKVDCISENFGSTPSLGNDAYYEKRLSRSVLNVGLSISARYPQGEGVAAINPSSLDETLLSEVETALWPGPQDWATRERFYKWQRAIEGWEKSHPRPAIGYRHYGSDLLSEGYQFREGIRPKDANSLSLVGIPTVVSDLAKEFLATQTPPCLTWQECATECLRFAWTR